MTLARLCATLTCALIVARSAGFGQAVTPQRSVSATLAELEAFLAAQPKWNLSGAVSGGFGYNDNLLLSFAGEEKSPLLRGGVELLLMRVPQDRFDFSFYVEAEATRYTAGKTVDDDAKVWVRTEPTYRIGESVRVGMPVTGYYYDQIFDQSDTEVERIVAELKVFGAIVSPTVRWDFHENWWVEAQGSAQRKWYDDRTQNGDIGEGAVRVAWSGSSWLEVQLSGGRRWRNFDSRTQYSSSGRELPDTELKIAEHEAELGFNVTWDEAERWKTSSRASLLHYRDNGPGFFNFREQKVSQELEWNGEPWRVRMRGTAARIDYGVQTVGLGIAPPARLRDEFTGELWVERKLNSKWLVFGGYTWERARSNDFVASYTVNEGLLGVRWSWEK
jgi:hypothetical protein